VINGQKMWGTGTERATHIAMAVRTDPDGKLRSGGISVILLPVDLPGVTIQPNMALYGHNFCTQFFDDVRVPAGYLLGEENQGWAVLGGALAAERIMMGGTIVGVQKIFEDLCAYVAGRADLRDDRRVRDMLGQFAAEIHAARALSLNSVRALQDGRLPLVEGAMAKVFSGDLTERLMEAALDILGASATLGEQADGAPLDGVLEQTLRRSIMLVIGGGAAEIQKTLIAQRGLGLPR
jgi:alkylation response protein AidB-like acyl-CoA dehydrogenase